MRIVTTAKISSKHQAALTQEFPQYQFSFNDLLQQTPPEELAQADILLTYGEDVTPELLQGMPNLKWIQVISAGLDLILFTALEERQITLTNARGIHAIPMSEYALGMILQLARKHYSFYDQQKSKKWDRTTLRIDEVHGKTLGIVGLGAIGEEIAKKAKAFGMNVLGLRRRSGDASEYEYIDELIPSEEKQRLFQASDYIVLLLPHTPQTEHFVGTEELASMKESAYLINMARGKIVDEDALLDVLSQNRIAGAVLDVFTEEPLAEEHPFWTLENVILTPHVSGRSPLYMTRALDIFRYNLKHYPELEKLQNLIPLSRGY